MGRQMSRVNTSRAVRFAVALLAAVWTMTGVVWLAGATERDASEVSRITREVSEGIESPYCPGQSLAMCPSSNAAETRRDVQDMAREGMDAPEIKEELVDRYGEGYEFHEPPQSDQVTLLVGIVLGLALAVGAVGFMARQRMDDFEDDDDGDGPGGRGGGTDEDSPGGGHSDEAYLEQLRAEVGN